MMGAAPEQCCLHVVAAVMMSCMVVMARGAHNGEKFVMSHERIYKTTEPVAITLPFNDETMLQCEMNVMPDRFLWRFFPLGKEAASNPNALLNLSKAPYVDLPPHAFSHEKKKSTLTIKMTNYTMAGDYQCLAVYGASVIASIPDRITLTTLEYFPQQNSTYITVAAGNTILWRCNPPYSNPPAYIDYSRNGSYISQNPQVQTTSLILTNVTQNDSGLYKCKAMNTLEQKYYESSTSLHLFVTSTPYKEMPRFLTPPKSNYTVKKGEKVFLECGAIGSPVPRVTWIKINGQLQTNRTELLPGGLQISNVTNIDEGVYKCQYTNTIGTISHSIALIYIEEPTIIEGPKSVHIKEGENLELECIVRGTPEPQISWLLNGKSVLTDKQIEQVGKRIYFMAIEKRHAGVIQCFATNIIGTTYSSADLKVIPKQISSTDLMDVSTLQPAPTVNKRKKHKHKNKHKGTSEMIPPSKPTVSRLSDESVVVRWSVPHNDGLPIQFFKVQYRELGSSNNEDGGYGRSRSSRWRTNNVDIAPNIRSFEVNNLKPDHIYKFRIAAVYSNNDNKLSPKSDKFHLNREGFLAKNPLPIPVLAHTEAINSTSIRIFWEHTPIANTSVEGFLISYMSASSAGDYMKATVDGEKTNSYVITHLVPDTVYDIKMQSFNSKMASEFSPILKEKTKKIPSEISDVAVHKETKETPPEHPNSSLYIFIGGGVVILALLLSVTVFLIICRKWKQNKDTDSARGGDRSDKPAVEEINHHIQAEANDYVVGPKNMPRSNGCALPNNRITITANPLADAENKSQNMIEMSCLSSQNNNCTPSATSSQERQQAAAAQQNEPLNLTTTTSASSLPKGKSKSKSKNKESKRRKHNNIEPPAGENYV